MPDVVVVGGGPIGSRLAYRLSTQGYQVVVLEKNLQIGKKLCCTGILSQQCVTDFAIPSSVVWREVNSAKIYAPSGEFIRIQRPETQAYIVNRPALDLALADAAMKAGAEYRLKSKVEQIQHWPGKVVVQVVEPGRIYNLEAQCVVLATGFAVPLVRKLKLGQPRYLVTGVQVEVETSGLEEVEVYFSQTLAPAFFAWLVPTQNGKGLAGLMSPSSAGLYIRNWLDDLKNQSKILTLNSRIQYSGIPLKPLSRTYAERILVVGDAAGQVKPTTGGGIYFGLIGADIAAETIHKAFQTGNFSARRLSDYERAWKKKLGQELRQEYYARRIYTHLNDQQINKLFSGLKSSGIVESMLKEETISFDWHGGLLLKAFKSGLLGSFKRLLHKSS